MTSDKAPCCNTLIKNIEAEATFPPLPHRALVNGMTAREKNKPLMLRRAKKKRQQSSARAGGRREESKINLCLRTYQFHLNFLAEPQTKHLTRLLLLLLLLKKTKERKKERATQLRGRSTSKSNNVCLMSRSLNIKTPGGF